MVNLLKSLSKNYINNKVAIVIQDSARFHYYNPLFKYWEDKNNRSKSNVILINLSHNFSKANIVERAIGMIKRRVEDEEF